MRQLLDLVADRRNVAGLVGALTGLGLTFGHVIGDYWLAITAGLYATGFLGAQLLAPAASEGDLSASPVAELPDDLRRLAARYGGALPPSARAHLDAILATATSIEPKLRAIDPANPSVIAVRQIMADYIPATLRQYAALPARVRETARLSSGATVDAHVSAQLALLDTQMAQVATNLSSGDLIALETQGRFLDAKFNPGELGSL